MMQAKLVLLLALSQVVVFQTITAETDVWNYQNNAGDIKALCKGKQVDVFSHEDLNKLVDNLDKVEHDCPGHVVKAMRAMAKMTAGENPCTMEKADLIINFVNDYLKKNNGRKQQLPKELVEFTINYGMAISEQCKERFIAKFLPKATSVLKTRFQGKFGNFEKFLVEDSQLGSVLSLILKDGEVILPSDLAEVVPDVKAKLDEYFSNDSGLIKLKDLCERTLQPLYEPVLLPLAKLNRAGFINDDFLQDEETENKNKARFWSYALFMCESIKNQVPSKFENTRYRLWKLSPYKPVGTSTSLVVNRHLPKYRKLVKSYDANKSEVERLNERLLADGTNPFKFMFKESTKKALVNKLLETLSKSDKEFREASEGLSLVWGPLD